MKNKIIPTSADMTTFIPTHKNINLMSVNFSEMKKKNCKHNITPPLCHQHHLTHMSASSLYEGGLNCHCSPHYPPGALQWPWTNIVIIRGFKNTNCKIITLYKYYNDLNKCSTQKEKNIYIPECISTAQKFKL